MWTYAANGLFSLLSIRRRIRKGCQNHNLYLPWSVFTARGGADLDFFLPIPPWLPPFAPDTFCPGRALDGLDCPGLLGPGLFFSEPGAAPEVVRDCPIQDYLTICEPRPTPTRRTTSGMSSTRLSPVVFEEACSSQRVPWRPRYRTLHLSLWAWPDVPCTGAWPCLELRSRQGHLFFRVKQVQFCRRNGFSPL